MSKLTDLEREAINSILAEYPEHFAVLNDQLQSVAVERRENTGGGFFTSLSVTVPTPEIVVSGPLGIQVYGDIEGLDYGIEMLLHFEDGRMSLLEGYSVGGEDTSGLNFELTSFSIISEPPAWQKGSHLKD